MTLHTIPEAAAAKPNPRLQPIRLQSRGTPANFGPLAALLARRLGNPRLTLAEAPAVAQAAPTGHSAPHDKSGGLLPQIE